MKILFLIILQIYSCKQPDDPIKGNQSEGDEMHMASSTLAEKNEDSKTIKLEHTNQENNKEENKPHVPSFTTTKSKEAAKEKEKNLVNQRIGDSEKPSNQPDPIIGSIKDSVIKIEKHKILPSEKISENIDSKEETSDPVEVKKIDHQLFDQLLSTYVQNGKVDYRGLKEDRSRLDNYLETLSKNPPLPSSSKKAKLAFWINAYNAFTLKLIIDNYPINSITELEGGNPWDVKWIIIGDEKLSLNNIENDIIRPTFKEPRIHFAVNCAAVSCPPLASEAFSEENLERLLESRTSQFINNSNFNILQKSSIKISKIFEWYKADFPNLLNFINKYSSVDISPKASVAYKEYDWALNEK